MKFSSPVGDENTGLWPVGWYDANPYGRKYELGYHTGADLNMRGDADAHAPVYAIGDGVVTFAGQGKGTWYGLIVIRHETPRGRVYSRYGHVENILVKAGDTVRRRQQIANVGNAGGRWPYHLHFDISRTDVLEGNPSHWPGFDLQAVYEHYVDPFRFLLYEEGTMAANQELIKKLDDAEKLIRDVRASLAGDSEERKYVVTASSLNLRAGPGTSYAVIDVLRQGQYVYSKDPYDGGWMYVRVESSGKYGYVAGAYIRPT